MKPKTRYFLLSIGAISIISIVIGQAFLPPRWSYIFYGILAFIFGSVAQTEEWKTGKRVRAVVFVIAIVVGGLLTTKGWNEWGNYSQKKTLLTALAREWMVNETYQHSKPLSFDPNDPDLGEIHYIYHPFKTFASNLILRSNLFYLRDKDERELCLETMFYEIHATSCNEMLVFYNWECTRKGTTKEHRKKLYQQFVRGSIYGAFKESHGKIGMLLKKRYNWALDEAVLLINEKAQKELREKYKWLSEETLNNKVGK